MNAKKSMFIIWLVASLLWACFSFYMFRINNVAHIYRMHDRYTEKVAKGRRAEPYRYEYFRRAYTKSSQQARDASRRLTLFLMVGIAFPGIMLAVGTAVMENADKPKKRKKA